MYSKAVLYKKEGRTQGAAEGSYRARQAPLYLSISSFTKEAVPYELLSLIHLLLNVFKCLCSAGDRKAGGETKRKKRVKKQPRLTFNKSTKFNYKMSFIAALLNDKFSHQIIVKGNQH